MNDNIAMTFVEDYFEIPIISPTSGSGVFFFGNEEPSRKNYLRSKPRLINLDCEKCGGQIEMHGNKGFCLHCGHRVMLV